MPIINKVNQVRRKLNELNARYKKPVKVKTGFRSKHAVYVHELKRPTTLGLGIRRRSGLGVYWGPAHFGPKFLERSVRELASSGELARIVVSVVRESRSIEKALLVAGLAIQRLASTRVPVEYGNLIRSAFTEKV